MIHFLHGQETEEIRRFCGARVPENVGQADCQPGRIRRGERHQRFCARRSRNTCFRNTPGRRLGRAFEALGNLSDIRQALGPDARLDSLTYERLTLPAVQVLMNVAEPVNRAALAAYQAFEAGPADGAPGSLKIARRPVRKSHLAKAAEALAAHRRALESLEDIAASSPLDSEAIRTAVERNRTLAPIACPAGRGCRLAD